MMHTALAIANTVCRRADRFHHVKDPEAFFRRAYKYYHAKGFRNILLSGLFSSLSVLFLALLLVFVSGAIDVHQLYRRIHAKVGFCLCAFRCVSNHSSPSCGLFAELPRRQ